MRLTIVGTGYVGLVTGACFAEMGNHVTCVDIDEDKIDGLKHGVIPIHEPGLEEIVSRQTQSGLLDFATLLAEPMNQSDVVFIAVGTPAHEDGAADLQHVMAVASQIGQELDKSILVADKSTVPIGTADKVKQAIQDELEKRGADIQFSVISNPEFLKEGDAVEDFMRPDRIVVGAENEADRRLMRQLYAPFTRHHERFQFMGLRDAEMTKYAVNAMLAAKISLMNEIASLCDRYDVDVENVRLGIGSDQRIGYSFIYPGCGYGGSCLPKDVRALIRMGEDVDFEPSLIREVESRNNYQKGILIEKIKEYYSNDLTGRTFGIWGLAFKPKTDDVREAPSIGLIKDLTEAGAKVVAFDPQATETARQALAREGVDDSAVTFVKRALGAVSNVDALILVTEWKMFRQPDFRELKRQMKAPVIFDGRNQYDPHELENLGIRLIGIGRRNRV